MVFQPVYRKIHSALMQLYLAIHTTGSKRVEPGAIFMPYVAIPYRAIFPILTKVGLTASDVFVDVGCGKGRMICCAGRSQARKVIGIDFDPILIEAAQANALR